MASEEHSRPFDDRKAMGYIDKWVSTVAHPELTWAWDVACGVIELYAALSTTRKKSLAACRREQWFDWFASWDEGDAHFGIRGAKEEVENAIPLEHWDSFCVTLDQARQIGETGRMPTDDSTPRREKPSAVPPNPAVVPAKPAAVALKLVVNNVSKVATTPPRKR